MKFVALLSGGKDSCYNAVKCVEHGHELVCLANLLPPEDFEGEELNSFMYQSAAFNAIPMMAECFEVPLIRRHIRGKALVQSLDYVLDTSTAANNDTDEVEDLYELLLEVKRRYPDCQGVSCGAIVSTYQRLRLEHVCNRATLKMIPLCYLWMRDREALVPILVKVAGAGLQPQKHLGKSLSELKPQLLHLHNRFGLDLCGEGGEYETLVLDCSLFPHFKLRVDAAEIVEDAEDCDVGNYCIRECRVTQKDTSAGSQDCAACVKVEEDVRVDSALACDFMRMNGETSVFEASHTLSDGIGHTGLLFASFESPDGPGSISSQTQQCMRQLVSLLHSVHAVLGDVVFIHLYVRDISDFALVNEAYIGAFSSQGGSHKYPPSRVCVATSRLPLGVNVALDAMYYIDSYSGLIKGHGKCLEKRRSVHHVQSISEWAPVCIGPYSQANTIGDCLTLSAGQIPLDPATMQLLDQVRTDITSFDAGSAFSLDWLFSCLFFHNESDKIQLSSDLIQKICDFVSSLIRSECNIDRSSGEARRSDRYDEYDDEYEYDDGDDDDKSTAAHDASCDGNSDVPILVVGVDGLPKDAIVEVEVASTTSAMKNSNYCIHKEIIERSTDEVESGRRFEAAEPVLPIHSWPLWSAHPDHNHRGGQGINNSSIHQNEVTTAATKLVANTNAATTALAALEIQKIWDPTNEGLQVPLQCRVSCRYLRGCVCAGIVSVSPSQGNLNSASTSWHQLILTLLCGVRNALLAAHLSIHKVLSIRCYYYSPSLSKDHSGSMDSIGNSGSYHDHASLALHTIFPYLCQQILRRNVPSIFIPVGSVSEPGCLLVGHLLAVDTVQYGTEKWILGANNINDSSGK
eukprot:GSChrysophyteH1.ASY1.ANO1.984.1 assembled CDS